MKILSRAIRTMETLPPADLMAVYNVMLTMKKRQSDKEDGQKNIFAYRKVRSILRKCPGSISEDIIHDREDRL